MEMSGPAVLNFWTGIIVVFAVILVTGGLCYLIF